MVCSRSMDGVAGQENTKENGDRGKTMATSMPGGEGRVTAPVDGSQTSGVPSLTFNIYWKFFPDHCQKVKEGA